MKKIIGIVLVLCIGVIGILFVKSNKSEGKGKLNIGMTVQDLTNQVWSATAIHLSNLVKAGGGSMTYLDCSNNSSKQIQQIEDFIARGVQAIIIQPVEKDSVETPLAEARRKGLKIFCWDENIENADMCWLIDNYAEGKIVGEYAAKWINQKLNGKAEVAILDYPQIQILLERANGIIDALKTDALEAEIVAQSSAINPTEGMAKMETIFQKNPNVKVVCCIGGGGAIGAVEAAKASGKNTADFGIFAVDGTDQEMEAIKTGAGERMSILNTGTPIVMADVIYDLLKQMLSGKTMKKIVYREAIPVTIDNVDTYYK